MQSGECNFDAEAEPCPDLNQAVNQAVPHQPAITAATTFTALW